MAGMRRSPALTKEELAACAKVNRRIAKLDADREAAWAERAALYHKLHVEKGYSLRALADATGLSRNAMVKTINRPRRAEEAA